MAILFGTYGSLWSQLLGMSALTPNFCARVIFRRPAGGPAGPNFAPKPPYAKFLLTLAHMPGFCSLPENPPGRPNGYPFGAPYARYFFRKFDFQKNFWYNFKKKHLRRAAHQKNSRSDVRTGLPHFFPAVALLFLRR